MKRKFVVRPSGRILGSQYGLKLALRTLPPADDFDREAAALGQSERFMSLLNERSREAAGTPLAEARRKRAAGTR